MLLIAILVCLALQKLADINNDFALPLFEKYLALVKKWLIKQNPWLVLTALVAPFIVALLIIDLITMHRLLGLVNLIIATLVLFFAMDAREFEKILEPFFTAINKNKLDSAAKIASEFSNTDIEKDAPSIHRSISKAIFARTFSNVFAPLFWFMICGAYGAAIYCLVVTISRVALKVDKDYAPVVAVANKTRDILDWVPIRIVTLTYALAGHFALTFNHWYKNVLVKPDQQQNFNMESGLAALNADPKDPSKADTKENNFALQLINRVLIIWVAAFVIFTLGSWL